MLHRGFIVLLDVIRINFVKPVHRKNEDDGATDGHFVNAACKPVGELRCGGIHLYFNPALGDTANRIYRFGHAFGIHRHEDRCIRHAQEPAKAIDFGCAQASGSDCAEQPVAIVCLDNCDEKLHGFIAFTCVEG